jgi:hypothetical protein
MEKVKGTAVVMIDCLIVELPADAAMVSAVVVPLGDTAEFPVTVVVTLTQLACVKSSE